MASTVDRQQRYTRARRCPICGGAEQDPRGKAKRCIGYLSPDAQWARCSRPELAGTLDLESKSETYVHKLHGPCRCGAEHGPATERDDIEALYDYRDESGSLLFQVVRKTGKRFLQRRPNGSDWIWKLGDGRRVLYRLPELIAAPLDATVYVVEGEKDVDALRVRGQVATCNPGGAGKWRFVSDHARGILAGRRVVIIADDDPPDPKTAKRLGHDHARDVAASVRDIAASVRVVRSTLGKDISDHFAAGGELGGLVELVELVVNGANGLHANGHANGLHAPAPDDDEVDRLEREALAIDGAIRVTEPWPEPYPFDAADVPPFPVDALSPWMRDWAVAESGATQTPVDLAACLALGASSLAVSRVFHVVMRAGWVEPTNLWLVVALPPGERKSVVYADATAPVYAYVQHETERMEPQLAADAFERRVIDGQLKEAEAAAIKGKMVGGLDARAAARRLRDDLEARPVLRAPRLLTDDCTAEALARLLADHGERMGIFSAEGGPFELMGGRYSDKGGNFEIYLKAHPGDPHLVDRVKNPPIALTHPLLTMALTVQPSVIAGLAAREGFRGRGLLARFFFALPTTALGTRAIDPAPLDEGIARAYQAALVSLLVMGRTPREVRLSDEADRLRSAFQAELEPRLGLYGDLHVIGDWAGKLVGGIGRIAGVLHVADHAGALDRLPEHVPAPTFARAIEIGRYLLAHARAAFDAMGVDESTDLAKQIAAWARRGRLDPGSGGAGPAGAGPAGQGLDSFTARQVQRALHRPAHEISAALAILIERALIRQRPADPTGGRPSESYDVRRT